MKSVELAYDRTALPVAVPDHWEVMGPAEAAVLADPAGAVRQALAAPLGTPPLRELAAGVAGRDEGDAVIVISDITRAVPNRVFLPPIIATLHAAGFRRERIVILVATGMHRPSTPAEHLELVGPDIARSYRLVDHRAEDPTGLVELPGKTPSGATVRIDAIYHRAALRIVTGFIEPHFMAGFSGGRKAICPGLVDLATVQEFHGAKVLADPRSSLGVLDGNPCHRIALEVARRVPPQFILNVTVNTRGELTGVFAGELEAAHLAGVEFVRRHTEVWADRPFDAVLASGGGYPLDTTFYQAVKGMCVAAELVGPGGVVALAAGCAQGIGSAEYRQTLFEYADDYRRFLRDILARAETRKDQWEFQMQTRVLEKTGKAGLVVLTDGIGGHELRRCHVTPAAEVVGEAPPGGSTPATAGWPFCPPGPTSFRE